MSEKQATLEQLSEFLNVDKTPEEQEHIVENLQDRVDELEHDIEGLKSDLENEKQRADEQHDLFKTEEAAHEVTQDKLDAVKDRIHEAVLWLQNPKKDITIEKIVSQLEWALEGSEKEPFEDTEENEA